MRPNVPSIAQICSSYPAEKRQLAPMWEKYVLRPLSFPITWLALKIGLSANQVTYLSAIAVLLGAALMMIDNRPYAILGALLFNLWPLLDNVDGNIARVQHTASKYGDFIDGLAGYLAWAFVFLGAGMAAENARAFIPGYLDNINFVLVGAIASVCNLTMRLINKHYALHFGKTMYGIETPQYRWSKEPGLTGFLMPAVLIGTILGVLHWIVLFYAAFHALALCIVALKMIISIEYTLSDQGSKEK